MENADGDLFRLQKGEQEKERNTFPFRFHFFYIFLRSFQNQTNCIAPSQFTYH